MLVFVAIVHVYFKKISYSLSSRVVVRGSVFIFYGSESISLLNADPDPENTICNNYFMKS